MNIVQISDTHIDPDHPSGARRLEDLNRIVAAINELTPTPDVAIHTGDVAHNGTAEKYAAALKIFDKLRCPLYIAAGNRDDRKLIQTNFCFGRALMPGTQFIQYEVDVSPVRLLALDTLSDVSNMGEFCGSRANSLRQALQKSSEKPCALFMHHPPFEIQESKYRWQFDSMAAIERLASAIEGQKNVIAVFCGHAHRVSKGVLAGVPATTVPSVALDLRLGELPQGAVASPVFYLHKFELGKGFKTELRIAQ